MSYAFGAPTSITDECVDVTDSFNGGDAEALGTRCVGDPGTSAARQYTFLTSQTVPRPTSGCVSYPNTARFTTNDTRTTGTASRSVEVCRVPPEPRPSASGRTRTARPSSAATAGTNCQALRSWLNGYAPFKDLTATNCTGVKGYVSNVIKNASSSGASMNTMLKAQMLGTALDVYFSTPGLGGNRISAPAPIGALSIDLTAICRMVDNHSTASATCSNVYRDSRAAFGGATSMTVSQMLSYAASQSNDGGSRWYGQVKATQELAKDAFDAINNAVAFLS